MKAQGLITVLTKPPPHQSQINPVSSDSNYGVQFFGPLAILHAPHPYTHRPTKTSNSSDPGGPSGGLFFMRAAGLLTLPMFATKLR